MMIAAKPTTYSNARFRSRLEAKWAAFFDLCGWRWEYEPLDLDGWVPDFGIVGHKGLILCEVKPIEWTVDSDDNFRMVVDRADLEKVKKSDRKDLLVLGAYPLALSRLGCIGWFYNSPYKVFDIAALIRVESSFDIAPWCDATLKLSPQEIAMRGGRGVAFTEIEIMWREASSLVQWNAKG